MEAFRARFLARMAFSRGYGIPETVRQAHKYALSLVAARLSIPAGWRSDSTSRRFPASGMVAAGGRGGALLGLEGKIRQFGDI